MKLYQISRETFYPNGKSRKDSKKWLFPRHKLIRKANTQSISSKQELLWYKIAICFWRADNWLCVWRQVPFLQRRWFVASVCTKRPRRIGWWMQQAILCFQCGIYLESISDSRRFGCVFSLLRGRVEGGCLCRLGIGGMLILMSRDWWRDKVYFDHEIISRALVLPLETQKNDYWKRWLEVMKSCMTYDFSCGKIARPRWAAFC